MCFFSGMVFGLAIVFVGLIAYGEVQNYMDKKSGYNRATYWKNYWAEEECLSNTKGR